MASLYYDSVNFNDVKNNTTHSINELQSVIDKFNKIIVTSDFSEYNNLSQFMNEIIWIKDDLKVLDAWVEDSIYLFNNTMDKINDDAILLPRNRVQLRNTVVK